MRTAEGTSEGIISVPPVTFRVTARGSGTPVVMIHGLSGSQRWWDRNVEAFSSGHQVLTVDLVGFGGNRRFLGGELPLPFDDAASVLGRWISSSFDESVHLIGHSMGGQIAILIAAAYPENVRSLVLVSSTGIPFRVEPLSHARNAMRLRRSTLSFGPVVARDFLRAGPTAVALAAARLLRADATEAMRALTMPVLLVWGERDPLVPEAYASEMLERIVGSRIEFIPSAGHIPMWENASAFNESVLGFLSEVEMNETLHGRPRAVRAFQWGIDDINDGYAWRCSAPSPEVMLVHGLGVTSAYFQPLARQLHRRGLASLAVDQPGYGWSSGDGKDPRAAARALITVADLFDPPPRIWVGHSSGCQLVEQVRLLRADLVPVAVQVSPIWSERPHRFERLIAAAPGDALLESPTLVGFAIASYLRHGLWQIAHAMKFYVDDAARSRTVGILDLVVIGEDDPLVDRERVSSLAGEKLRQIAGPHGLHFSHAEELADVIATVAGPGRSAARDRILHSPPG